MFGDEVEVLGRVLLYIDKWLSGQSVDQVERDQVQQDYATLEGWVQRLEGG